MFSFLQDMGNYDSRKVDRSEYTWGFISTAEVSDGEMPYETAVRHKDYNGGDMVIVDKYDSSAQARVGHAKWVKTMMAKELPTELVDCNNSMISQLCIKMGGETTYKRNQ